MLQLHLSYQQLYCLPRCDLYKRFYGNFDNGNPYTDKTAFFIEIITSNAERYLMRFQLTDRLSQLCVHRIYSEIRLAVKVCKYIYQARNTLSYDNKFSWETLTQFMTSKFICSHTNPYDHNINFHNRQQCILQCKEWTLHVFRKQFPSIHCSPTKHNYMSTKSMCHFTCQYAAHGGEVMSVECHWLEPCGTTLYNKVYLTALASVNNYLLQIKMLIYVFELSFDNSSLNCNNT